MTNQTHITMRSAETPVPMDREALVEERTARTYPDIHSQIMNIQVDDRLASQATKECAKGFNCTDFASMEYAYRLGHRDARHAAAEIVAEVEGLEERSKSVPANDPKEPTPAPLDREALTRKYADRFLGWNSGHPLPLMPIIEDLLSMSIDKDPNDTANWIKYADAQQDIMSIFKTQSKESGSGSIWDYGLGNFSIHRKASPSDIISRAYPVLH